MKDAAMTLAELEMLTATLAEAHRQLKIGGAMEISLNKNHLFHIIRALDLYGAVRRSTKDT